MTPEQFCYWLQGFLELGSDNNIHPYQVDMIKEHLNTVFDKKTTKTIQVGGEGLAEKMRKAYERGPYNPYYGPKIC